MSNEQFSRPLNILAEMPKDVSPGSRVDVESVGPPTPAAHFLCAPDASLWTSLAVCTRRYSDLQSGYRSARIMSVIVSEAPRVYYPV